MIWIIDIDFTSLFAPPPLWQLSKWLVSSTACSSSPEKEPTGQNWKYFSCENWTRSHSHQIFVELLKVAGNDGDGEGHDQHPADGTHTPHQLEIWGLRSQNFQVTFFHFSESLSESANLFTPSNWASQPHLAQGGLGEDIAVANSSHCDHHLRH